MEKLGVIYSGLVIMSILIMISGISIGYCIQDVGKITHENTLKNPSVNAALTVKNDDIKLLFTIWIANASIAFCLMTLLIGKFVSKYFKYLIYFLLSYQFINVAVLIGFALHSLDFKLILASLIPHGIVEIPIIILAAAFGIYYYDNNINTRNFLKTYLIYILIPLFVAAILETWLTPFIMKMFIN